MVGFRHLVDQGLVVPWFQQEVGCTVFKCFNGKFLIYVCGMLNYG